MSILPLPTSRVSDMLVGQRLVSQFQSSSSDLLNLEAQISSGQRITIGSQDAPAALRAIDLKGLLQQQTQAGTNLQAGQAYLTQTGSALSAISNTLSDLRATAISASGTTVTNDQRNSAVSQIDSSLQGLLNSVNQQYNGRYLFGGSASTTPPFQLNGNTVTFNGNTQQLQTFVDQNYLFPTNVSAQESLGALSPPINSATFNPVVTSDTKLANLNGGKGVSLGSVVVSDGTKLSTVDLSSAETVGDVVSLLEAHPPDGRTLNVQVTSTGLNVSLDSAGGGQLSISELNGGTTAADLGILHPTGPIVGTALNPQITAVTPLAGLTVGGVSPDLTSGLQIVNGGNTYTVDLSSAKTVGDLVNLLNGSPAGLVAQINAAGNGLSIQSKVSGGGFSIGENGGQTATQLGIRTFTGTTQLADLNGGLGVHANSNGTSDFVIQRKDGSKLTYSVSGLTTVNDVLNLINNDPNNQNPANKVTAQLATTGNGIQLVTSDPSSTAAFSVSTLNGSQAAIDLGLVPAGQATSAAAVTSGGKTAITGSDVNPTSVGGIFDSILKIRQALVSNDGNALNTALANFDTGTTQMQNAEAEVGAQQQTLDALQTRQTSQQTDIQSAISDNVDTDVVQASIDLQNKETAFQATLKLAATISQLSLMNYL